MLRIQSQSMLKSVPRRGDMPCARFKNAKIVPSIGIAFEKLQRGALLFDGLLQVAGRREHLRQTGMNCRIVRLQLSSLLEFGERTLQIA